MLGGAYPLPGFSEREAVGRLVEQCNQQRRLKPGETLLGRPRKPILTLNVVMNRVTGAGPPESEPGHHFIQEGAVIRDDIECPAEIVT